ncbi:hypothetical protein [Methylophilus sp.]|jgi:hypothetical protein|uniref:hypothetical protein n=1 Tax=Methylophilus sp. TaxID=29541 RepID=UPI0011D788FB|nr:hypothetical protein [Methylophilus sp.]TXI47531.1 MAG: hypothetical protein E6Q52_00770 [Methylophilus sp.]
MRKRDEILKEIEKKQSQKAVAERESQAWNNGKYKGSSNAQMSKTLVASFDKALQDLYQELENTPE